MTDASCPAHMKRAKLLLQTFPQYATDFVTRRRSSSFAEYCKHFVARLNDVHAFGYNSAGSERIWMKFGALRVHCLELALTDFGRDTRRSESGSARARADFLFFFCQVNNERLYRFLVGQISRNLHTRRGSARWWILSEGNFQNFFARGRFSQNPFLLSSRTTSDFMRR